MSRPAVFFDRDNTLIVNSEYLGDPAQVELIPGAPEAVARARALGFATVVVSNQSGVARGMFSEDDVRAVNARMDAMLLEADERAIVDRHEYCPTHPAGTVKAYCLDDDRRKPKPGMIRDAAEAMDLDLKRSWLIGDAPRDIAAGHAAGCRTILLRETFRTASPAAAEADAVEPDYVASSLLDAIDFIEMNLDAAGRGPLITPPPATAAVHAAGDTNGDGAADDGDDARDVPVAPADSFSDVDPVPGSDSTDSVIDVTPIDPAPATAEPERQRTPAEIAAAEAANAEQIASVFAGRPRVNVGTQPHVDAPPRRAPGNDWTSDLAAEASSSRRGVPRTIGGFVPPAPSGGNATAVAEPVNAAGVGSDRETVQLLERVVEELRRANDPPQDFSVARMLGGIVQGFALATFVAAVIFRDSPSFMSVLGVAIFLQVLVSSLYLMGR